MENQKPTPKQTTITKAKKMDHTTKQIAKQRIQTLIQQAKKTHQQNPNLATNYIKTARKIAMAAKTPLPPEIKNQICKKCNTLLTHGQNCRARTQQKRQPHIVITCLTCGHQKRINLKPKKEKNKT